MGAVNGHKVVVEIEDFGDGTKNPEGKVIEILGHANDPGVDILSIVRAFGLPEEFPDEVMRQTEKIPSAVSPDEMAGRMDFRNFQTVTPGPGGAQEGDERLSGRPGHSDAPA